MIKEEKNKNYKEKICMIIPTKDRYREVRRLLESIRSQSRLLDQIVVVDASVDPEETKGTIAEFPEPDITYVRKYPPSLIPQRNAGLEAVAPGISLVGFLDDDIVLEPGCVEAMYDFWDTAGPEVGGAEYNIIYDSSSRSPSGIHKWVEKIFLISDKKKKGEILLSGFGVSPYPAERTGRLSWLSGGCNVYRRQIFQKFKFDDWYAGWGAGDDLEFSYRVAKEYELYVVAEAQLKHLPLPTKPGMSYSCGKIITINQFHFTRMNREFSLFLCAWANLGRALVHLFKGIFTFNLNSLQRHAGHLVGIYKGLTGTLQALNQNVK